jgi:hypothetical protein
MSRANLFRCGQKAMHGMAPECHQYFRLKHFELSPQEILRARPHLFGKRVAISRRAAFHDIGNKHILSLHTNVSQHLIQKFPRCTNKRFPLFVFARSRCLTDKDNATFHAPFSGHGAIARAGKRTLIACTNLFSNGSECIRHGTLFSHV